ncbi:hypothetical protein HMPREF9422_1673 [Streptococcus cristatus ATCC 51100]|uniref:Uncharacterized protein n=1 Tax=Streptococcus cristatus ATCC 51100 TaxID=889201 RepID=A0AAV3EGW9_STRCR|nr:hypothetical protein HMPREF9422_1673 [Streptococcus cristatus ATCC 51100]EGU68530.1 hypothetical protein HMPREF9960_0979 [Streptococcus cristatus ATCC 51100]
MQGLGQDFQSSTNYRRKSSFLGSQKGGVVSVLFFCYSGAREEID